MKRFFCNCGQEIYFDNLFCGVCGSQIGFDPGDQNLHILIPGQTTWKITNQPDKQYRVCEHRDNELQCNWLIPAESHFTQCLSCSMTRQIPMLDNPDNWVRWQRLESAKRRLFYGLLVLDLPLGTANQKNLVFDFLEDKRSNPSLALEHVLSGHNNGVITINAAEADGSFREAAKEAMNEPYRTLLGHFRHETGHYYWDVLIKKGVNYDAFQQLFGDEQQDYAASLDAHYATGPRADWQQEYISAYASAHPMEDWAETWAHYLLMIETLETGFHYGVIERRTGDQKFELWFEEWLQLVRVINALNRSTGHADAYPFVVSQKVQQKLEFIHKLITENQS